MTTFTVKVGCDVARLARILHLEAPPDATRWELTHLACLRWDDLRDHEIGQIVERVVARREAA